MGAALLGAQPPTSRACPARARPRSTRATATGASRRRATRRAATASTASTRSGSTPTGYFSDQEKTNYDLGFGDCRAATNPNPTYGDGVVTPHASFLAMMHEPRRGLRQPRRIQEDLGAYGGRRLLRRGGRAIAGRSPRRYLSLDQAMVMGAIGNVLANDVIRRAFATRRSSGRCGR